MNTTTMRNIADLPVLEELESPSWGVDYGWVTDDLYQRPYQGLLQTPSGDVFVYRNVDLAALRAHPSCTHQTLSAMTHGLRQPDSLTESGIGRMLGVNTASLRHPEHKPAKSLITQLMTPRTLAPLAGDFNDILTALIDSALEQQNIDFVTDFARPAVARFWQSALGHELGEAERLIELGTQFQLALRVSPSREEVGLINEAANEFMDLTCAILSRSARSGKYPWLNQLLAQSEQMSPVGRPQDPIAHLASPLIDGFHTLVSILGSVVTALIDAGIQPRRIDRDVRSFATAAFLEGTRLHPAIAAFARQAGADIEFDDVLIPKDTNIYMGWLFGNRDPEVFENPASYRLDRVNRVKQFTFGGGPYMCAGRTLVQVLSEWLLAELAERDIEFERTGEASWDPGSWLHDLRTLPVSVTTK